MAVFTECLKCGETYKFPDEKAGRSFRCRICNSPVEIPTKRTPARPPRKSWGAAAGNSGLNSRVLFLGGIAAGAILLLGGGVIVGKWIMSDSRADRLPPANRPAGLTASGIAAEDLTEEEVAERHRKYQENLETRRRELGDIQKNSLTASFGQDKVLTVVFTNVVGETEAAHRYLERKVFRAAYDVYSQGQKMASQQTERNKKAAEEKAIRDRKKQLGNIEPLHVWYRYQVVRSEYSYPRVINAGRRDNTFTYHVGPAVNAREFAQKMGVGPVTKVSGREVHINAQLPTPIPDPDVEELVIQYGADKVVHVNISGAEGDPELVQLFFRTELATLREGGRSVKIVSMKPLGDGRYEFWLAPILNIQGFAESIRWGRPESIDADQHTVTIAAALPEHLPTHAELAAAKEEIQAAEDAIKAQQKAVRDADWSGTARPGEAELDWAIRVVKEGNAFKIKGALKALAEMDVDEDRQEEVVDVLTGSVGKPFFYLQDLLPAIIHWKTDKTEQFVLSLGGKHMSQADQVALMEALVALNTPSTATALATGITDFFVGDETVGPLIKMGPLAEKPVLQFLKHRDAQVRRRVYSILSEVGGRDSLKHVKSNVKLENDPTMRIQAQNCEQKIRQRVEAAEAAEAGDGEAKPDE